LSGDSDKQKLAYCGQWSDYIAQSDNAKKPFIFSLYFPQQKRL